jgi:hypothetical protein
MGKTVVSEKDSPDLERLEYLVKIAGYEGVGTTALSQQSGIRSEKIRRLFNNHFSRVSRKVACDSKAGIPADLWVYKPTPDDISAPHRAAE